MKVKVFFTIISAAFDRTNEFEGNVNRFLEEHPGATVQWLQSSAGCGTGTGGMHVSTTITAVVIYDFTYD